MRLPGPAQLLRRWTLLVLASLLVLVAFAVAAPAAAQESTTLVSNIGQTFDADNHSGDFRKDYATSFTTGPSSEGYRLTGVDLYLKTSSSNVLSSEFRTRIAPDAGGTPLLGTACGPSNSLSGSFAARRFLCAVDLAPNTKYWVVIGLTQGSNADRTQTSVSGTDQDHEDSGAFPGWRIANDRLKRDWNTILWESTTNTNALRMNLVGYANDQTAPVARSGRLAPDGRTLKLYYDEELDRTSVPAATHFNVKVAATDQEPTEVAVAGSTVTLTLSTAEAATAGQSVAVSYNADAAVNTPVRDPATNKAGNLAGLPVTNEVGATVPEVSAVSIVSKPTRDPDSTGTPDTYGAGAQIEVQLTYGEAVTVDAARGRPRLKIKMHEDFGEKWAVYERGSGTTALTFAYTVVIGNSSDNGTTDEGIAVLEHTLELTGGAIRSTATGRDASVGHTGLGHDASHKVDAALDGQGPRLVDATVRSGLHGSTLRLDFDEPLEKSVSTPASSFCVAAATPDGSVKDFCGKGNVTYSAAGEWTSAVLSGHVKSGDVVTVRYEAPGALPLVDEDSQVVADFSGKPVTNNIQPPGQPTLSVGEGSDSGSLAVSWTPPSATTFARGYDLRYYQGAADPPAGREADWIEQAPGLPKPGTATSATIKGLLAGTAYRVQVRVTNYKGTGAWTASVAETTAAAPSTNNAPRVLGPMAADAAGNVCRVHPDPLNRDTLTTASSGGVTSELLTGRRAETTEWPSVCSGAGSYAPVFDDQDSETLTITAEPEPLPANVRLDSTFGLAVSQQTATVQGRFWFAGAAAFRATDVWATLTAVDPHGASASTRGGFRVPAVGNVNGKPQFSATVPDQDASTSRAVSLVLPDATGGDTGSSRNHDVQFPYYYAVSGLPEGLVFDPATRTISGTPLKTGAFDVTYTADDADNVGSAYLNPETVDANDAVSGEFTITVAPRIELVRVVSAPTHDANGDGKFDTYGLGDTIVVDVEYSGPVEVQVTVGSGNGVGLRLLVGRDGSATQKRAEITGVHHGGKTLRFAYEVQRADFDPDGVQVGAASGDRVVLIRGSARVTSVATGRAADLTKSGLVTGGAVDRDGVPITYVNGRVTAAGPKPASAAVNGDLLTVTFDKGLDNSAPSDVMQNHFGVQGADGTGGNRNALQHPSKVAFSDHSVNTVWMTLDVPARQGEEITLSYWLFDHQGPLRDTDGNLAPPFHALEVDNVTGVAAAPLPLYASVAGTALEIVFDGALQSSSTVPGSAFTVVATGLDDRRSEIEGTGTATASGTKVTVTLAEAVDPDDLARVSYKRPGGSNNLQNSAGVSVLPFDGFRVETVGDVAAPKLVGGAAVQTRTTPARTEVALYFDETLDPGSVPAVGDFEVTVGTEAAATPSSVAVEGSAAVLTVNAAAAAGATVRVVYTVGTNPIRDPAHNEAAAFDTDNTDDLPEPLTASASGTPVVAAPAGVGAKLVGNTGQTHAANVSFLRDRAQPFTTGGHGLGYRLTSLVVPYADHAPPDGSSHSISIHPWDSQTQPGDPLGTLSYDSRSGLTVTYTAEGTGIDLDSGTNYFVVFDATTVVSGSFYRLTDTGAEDPGAADGWSLFDGTLFRTQPTSSDPNPAWTVSASEWQIAIHGYEKTLARKVDGARVTLTYDSPLDPGSVPDPERFKLHHVRFSGQTDASVEYARVDAVAVAGKELRLTLENPVSPCAGAAPFTVTYGRSATGKNLQTLTGHQAPDIEARKVTNARTHLCVGGRVVVQSGGDPAEDGGSGQGKQAKSLTLKFERTLDTGRALKASLFGLSGESGEPAPAVAGAAYTADGAGVVLTLERALGSGETVTLSYTRPADEPGLWDAEGHQIADFSGVAVPVVTAGTPAVTGVEVVSDAGGDDTYALGETIRVAVTFGEAVEVEGAPRLKIDMDPADWGEKRAVYESGSGTTELVFVHTVVEPNESTRGIAVLADTLEANGGTIRSASAGADADLSHPGLDHDPNHKVDWRLAPGPAPDTTAPALAAARVDGRTLILTFDEALAAVDTGALTFAFVVDGIIANGSVSPGRVVIDGATVTLHLGTGAAPGQTVTVSYFPDAAGNALRDAAGNPVAGFDGAAVENGPRPAAPATASAVRVSSTPEEGDTYGPGETIRVTVAFSEAVAVTGSPRLKIKMDPGYGAKWAAYEGGSGTAELTFAYEVAQPNESTQGIAVLADSLELNGGTIESASSRTDADLDHDGLDHDPNHKVDTTPRTPAVTGVAVVSDAGEDDTYAVGDAIRVTLTFDEAVAVTGSPRLKIKMDPGYGQKWAVYEGGSGTTELTFAYTVAEPNESTQGIAVLANSLELNDGTIESASSRTDADLAHDGLAHDPEHKVDWRG